MLRLASTIGARGNLLGPLAGRLCHVPTQQHKWIGWEVPCAAQLGHGTSPSDAVQGRIDAMKPLAARWVPCIRTSSQSLCWSEPT